MTGFGQTSDNDSISTVETAYVDDVCNTATHFLKYSTYHYNLMQDPLGLLHGPLLCHRCISEDQQVLCKLQQTSKGLQAAVADAHSGQVHIVLSTARVQQADAFVVWLRKHAGLLQQLELDLLGSSWRYANRRDWVASALAAALQHAAAAGCLRLHSFSLKGSVAGAAVLAPLAAQLTHLAVDSRDGTDVCAIAAWSCASVNGHCQQTPCNLMCQGQLVLWHRCLDNSNT
jgi:hypothetical protein